MFFSLHGRVLTCIYGFSIKLCSLTMVFRGVPKVMSVFKLVLPEGLKITAIQDWFSTLSLVYKDFSRFSESTETADHKNLLQFYIEKHFCFVVEISLSQNLSLLLKDALFIPNHDADLFPRNLFSKVFPFSFGNHHQLNSKYLLNH